MTLLPLEHFIKPFIQFLCNLFDDKHDNFNFKASRYTPEEISNNANANPTVNKSEMLSCHVTHSEVHILWNEIFHFVI